MTYAGKRFAYSYQTYNARCQLAALDYQMHKDRPLRTTKDGKEMWHRLYNKNSARWTACPYKVEKSYCYVTDLLKEIFERRMTDPLSITRTVNLPEDDPSHIQKTIAPVAPPATKDIVSAKKSRFLC